jgi:hypothetical protein
MNMSVTITDEQYSQIEFYLNGIRTGEAYRIMESRRHHDAIVSLMAGLRPHASRENDEEIIRRNLLIWSHPSCP